LGWKKDFIKVPYQSSEYFLDEARLLSIILSRPTRVDARVKRDLQPTRAYVYDLIPELRAFAPRRGQQLSGGQQKLVALGRALMIGTKLLLLDEPFEGVAPALAQRLAEVISHLKDEGMAVIFSESDLQYSEHLVQKVYSIDRGAVTERPLKPRPLSSGDKENAFVPDRNQR